MATYWSDMCDLETCLYRAYIDGDLAYVGVSCNPRGRIATHWSRKPWWRTVDQITLEWFPNRTAAFDAERIAIRDENPIYNIVRPAVPNG